PDTPRYISYPVASAAGLLIAVCSCTILPLFAGIWKKGAGLGPAMTFLFTGPAINVLAILYTGSLIGWDIAAARGVLAIVFGILIGIIMGFIFERAKAPTSAKSSVTLKSAKIDSEVAVLVTDPRPESRTIMEMLVNARVSILFVLLLAILVVGASPLALELRLPVVAAASVLAAIWAFKMNTREENEGWMRETYFFIKMVLPLLLIGVFVAGVASELIPEEVVGEHLGSNTVSANVIAVGFGIFMYFPTLVEVPVARMFLDLGMAKGPLLAYLLADPELSLQSIFVTRKIIGNRKVAVYVMLVAVFCTVAGLIFGMIGGL
ncbi:MAG: permease, partial [Thermoplasmata archaeon]|nr:permease [Thermoplasmata archaeon]